MNFSFLKIFFNNIKNYFLQGFIILIPFFFTISILKTIINIISKWLSPLNYLHIPIISNIFNFPYGEIFLACFIVIFLGYILKKFNLYNIIIQFEEKIIKNITFIKSIYFGTKEIIGLLNKKKNNIENDVVAWVHLPLKNVYCLGLMTGKLDSDLSPDLSKNYYSFFIPHTPNPISGYYIIVSEGDFIFTNFTRHEAMSMIISSGIIRPEIK